MAGLLSNHNSPWMDALDIIQILSPKHEHWKLGVITFQIACTDQIILLDGNIRPDHMNGDSFHCTKRLIDPVLVFAEKHIKYEHSINHLDLQGYLT